MILEYVCVDSELKYSGVAFKVSGILDYRKVLDDCTSGDYLVLGVL